MGTSIKRIFLDVAGIRLCCVDFGGEGSPILLLHGLAGRANEWRSTAEWLTQHHHVFALDQRGHGVSDKTTLDYSRDAYVNDAISIIKQLNLHPVILIGQSMGGLNAFLVAARQPDLVRGLIIVEASASANPSVQKSIRNWLNSWPLPFPTLADARTYFGGKTLYAETWIEILEEHPDGYWPNFHSESMVQSMADVAVQDYWSEWERIQCPTLLVGGANSFLSQDELQTMAQHIPYGRYVKIPDAGHDLHLEQPDAWRQVAEAFLQELRAGNQIA